MNWKFIYIMCCCVGLLIDVILDMDLWNEENCSFFDSFNINFEIFFILDEIVDFVDIDSDDFKLCIDNELFLEDFFL